MSVKRDDYGGLQLDELVRDLNKMCDKNAPTNCAKCATPLVKVALIGRADFQFYGPRSLCTECNKVY